MNEPLLKDEEEKIAFANTPVEETEAPVEEPVKTEVASAEVPVASEVQEDTSKSEEDSPVVKDEETEVSRAPMHEIEATTSIDVMSTESQAPIENEPEAKEEEKEEPIATALPVAEEASASDAAVKQSIPKEKLIPYIVTLILSAIVIFLLVQTCLGFYFGFRYRNAEVNNVNSTVQK